MKFGPITVILLSSLLSAVAFIPSHKGAMGIRNTSLKATKKEDLVGAQKMIDQIIYEKACGPVMVRLAWHDSGTFDKDVDGDWPAGGGAVASIRFEPEINHGANAGLVNAIKLLEPVKKEYPDVSYADIFQMASARAVETACGPKLNVKYGRLDATSSEQCSPEGNLPDAEPADDGNYGGPGGTAMTQSKEPEGHLRKVFYRMGINDEEIVALSGAHTFGT
jgi:L-ascorbate peroxidase